MKSALFFLDIDRKLNICDYIMTFKPLLENPQQYEAIYCIIIDGKHADFEIVRKNYEQNLYDNISIIMNFAIADRVKFALLSKLEKVREKAELYSNFVYLSKITKSPYLRDEIQHQTEKSIKVSKIFEVMTLISSMFCLNCEDIYLTYNYTYIYDIATRIANEYNKQHPIMEEKIALPLFANQGKRVVGLDGNSRISEMFKNVIDIKINERELDKKVMSIFTDANHIKVSDPGCVEGNPLFLYVRELCNDQTVRDYLGYDGKQDLEERYKKGGVGDRRVKEMLRDSIKTVVSSLKRRFSDEEIINRIKMDTAYISMWKKL